MGHRPGPRRGAPRLRVRLLETGDGRVGQVLYPSWIDRSDALQMGAVLSEVDQVVASEAPHVSVLVTGGGFIEMCSQRRGPRRWWLSEQGLEFVCGFATGFMAAEVQAIAACIGSSPRDYVVGLDVTDVHGRGVGQFGLLYSGGRFEGAVWKSLPVDDESTYLAGFGTEKGRQSPRIVKTRLGKAMILVCHDAQAFNHFNQSRMRSGTDRSMAADHIHALTETEQPVLGLNLVHYIERPGSIHNTFQRSYRQMHEDWPWHPKAVGAFGYERNTVSMLRTLADACQWPPSTVGCTVAVEPGT